MNSLLRANPRWRRHVWSRFVSSGLFKPHYSKRATDVIVPNFEHPLVKRISGGGVTHAPNTAQIDHDEIVVRSILVLEKQQIIFSATFEAELKREDLRSLRHYNPSEKTKYPDLVIEVRGQSQRKKIAIELELSRKEPKR